MFKIKFKNGSTKEFRSLVGADLREANLRWADLGNTDLRLSDLRGASLRGANLGEASLRNADLLGADLWCANLRGADLRWADLLGASLVGADLRRANLQKTKGIKSFQGSRDLGVAFVFENKKWIKIGCESLKVEEWVRDYVKIGKYEDYTESQINEYGEFIKQINEMSVEELKEHIN